MESLGQKMSFVFFRLNEEKNNESHFDEKDSSQLEINTRNSKAISCVDKNKE